MKKHALALQWEEVTIADALADGVTTLKEAGVDSANLDARLLLARVLGVGREYLTIHSDSALSDIEVQAYETMIHRRATREPMAQILGEREFWSLNFRVTQDTLAPRPDSETLIEAVLDYVPRREAKLMIADFGTGTGCLLLSLLSEFPNAHGLGVDVSNAALDVAEKNAQNLGLSDRAHFYNASWGEGVMGRYDVIISNPPYIPEAEIATLAPEVATFEPMTALSGGVDGMDAYRALMPHVKRLLAQNGVAVLEFGKGQHTQVVEIAEASGLRALEFQSDLAGIIRCVVLAHAETQN